MIKRAVVTLSWHLVFTFFTAERENWKWRKSIFVLEWNNIYESAVNVRCDSLSGKMFLWRCFGKEDDSKRYLINGLRLPNEKHWFSSEKRNEQKIIYDLALQNKSSRSPRGNNLLLVYLCFASLALLAVTLATNRTFIQRLIAWF